MGIVRKLGWISLFMFPYLLAAQAGLLREKRIGVYISSSQFDYTEDYGLQAAQFLKLEEDRSYTGDLKTELMIRVGGLLSNELTSLAQADTVYFMNADLQKGYLFQQAYDVARNRLKDSLKIPQTDLILVINQLDMGVRSHRSVFIRSNRMLTEKIPVNTASLSVTLFDPGLPDLALELETCFDAYTTPKVDTAFDFFRDRSKLGAFFSQLFSQWWAQMEEGNPSNCEE